MSAGSYVFGLPPSLGPKPVDELVSRFQSSLVGSPFAQVRVLGSYADLESELHKGTLHAAWSPPIVCARIESAGGTVALRCVRYGSTTYRSVLLCRSDGDVDLKKLATPGGPKLRAAWVDEWSMGGCILPRYYLRSRGLKLSEVLEKESLLDSYGACFQAVLDGAADITASFAGRRGLGYVDLCGERASELRALAYTDESPNDGIAISPALESDEIDKLQSALVTTLRADASRELLATAFDVDGFDEPPPGTYSALLAFLA